MKTGTSAPGGAAIAGMLPRDQRLPTEPERSKDALIYAFSHLWAVYAERGEMPMPSGIPTPDHFRAERGEKPTSSGIPKLYRFRADVLADQPGHLLTPENVARWIEERRRKDGPPSWWLTGLRIDPEQIEERTDGIVLIRELRFLPTKNPPAIPEAYMNKELEELSECPTLSHRLLRYSTPESYNQACPVRADGTLDALRHLSLTLSYLYHWESQQATLFVLTGMVPVMDPTWLLPPAKVAIAKAMRPVQDREGRRTQAGDTHLQIRGRRAREMSVKHLELAVFTAWHEGETLAVRMAQWNARYPEWAYREVTNFGRDSREGMRRLWERMGAYIERGGWIDDVLRSPRK